MVDLTQAARVLQRQDEETQAEAFAQAQGVPYVNLVGYQIAPKVLEQLPKEAAAAEHAVPYLLAGQTLRIATPLPLTPEHQKGIRRRLANQKLQVQFSVCSRSSVNAALRAYDALPQQQGEGATIGSTGPSDQALKALKNIEELKEHISKTPTTKTLDVLFVGAVSLGATDIHFEPFAENANVRFRLDGILEDVASVPLATHLQIVSRIKNMAGMKLDVKGRPQDGRFDTPAGEETIEVRASTLPTTYGEAVELRLLTKSVKALSLEELGFTPAQLHEIEEAIARPNGMILVTGPTGSGKTTTLYAILKKLANPGIKIITLEDPVEYRLPGIDQVQIDPAAKFDFADGLRGALRQDPNVILVGEIRDAETAQIALQAAITGHLVLSTLHTNSAAAAYLRLIDLGVRPQLMAGAINLIISQRLVRRHAPDTPTGFKGRMVVAEVLRPSGPLEDMVLKETSLRALQEKAKALGMVTMEEDGLAKAAQGLTTKEEVWRVTKA